MVKKIIFSAIVLCLFIAIPLALLGYKQVELGTPFLALMKSINQDLENFKIAIPDIPTIPRFETQNDGGGLLEALASILNVLINFVNVIIFLVNTIADVLNIVIQLIQFFVLMVKNLVTFKDALQNYSIPVV